MRKFVITISFIIFLISLTRAQISVTDTDNKTIFQNISLAYQLTVYGYENQDPVSLCAAARILSQFPVKKNQNITIINTKEAKDFIPAKQTVLYPMNMLDDAIKMCDDELIITMLQDQLSLLDEDDLKDRGRKFCPYVQEYVINPSAEITLKTVFIEKEIAEVFVVNYSGNALDLKISDNKGKLLASNVNRIANCYVAFTPSKTGDFKIDIINRSNDKIQFLLMTN